MKKLLIIFSIFALLSSCATIPQIAYNRNYIIERFGDFETFLNGERIAFDTIFLAESNIESFVVNTRKRKMFITQIDRDANFSSLQHLNRDGEFKGILINGELLENTTIRSFEVGAIQSIEILRTDESGTLIHPRRGTAFLVLTLE